MKAKNANYFARGFVATILAIVVLATLGLIQYANAAGLAVTYVSKEGVYIFIHHHPTGRTAQSAPAKKLSQELAQKLNKSFRPVKRGGTGPALAHCTIVLRDWKDGEGDPNFQARCESRAGGPKSYPYVSMDLPETSAEVMKLVDGLVAEHKRRLARSN